MAQNEYAVRLEHVTKTFGPVVANKDVSLGVRRGEILALLGENGSGKMPTFQISGHRNPFHQPYIQKQTNSIYNLTFCI